MARLMERRRHQPTIARGTTATPGEEPAPSELPSSIVGPPLPVEAKLLEIERLVKAELDDLRRQHREVSSFAGDAVRLARAKALDAGDFDAAAEIDERERRAPSEAQVLKVKINRLEPRVRDLSTLRRDLKRLRFQRAFIDLLTSVEAVAAWEATAVLAKRFAALDAEHDRLIGGERRTDVHRLALQYAEQGQAAFASILRDHDQELARVRGRAAECGVPLDL